MLRDRSIRALLAAQLVSTSGTQMTFLALPWFVLATTGSAARMGAVLAAELVPVGLLGVPSGAVAARLGARRTMLICDAARVPLIVLVPVLHWSGALSFPALLAIVFCVGIFNAPYSSSRSSILPELLGEEEGVVAQASSLFEGGRTATTIAGPVIGGLLIGFIGSASVLVVDAASYVVAFALVAVFVRGGRRHATTDDARGVLAGIRFVFRDPLIGPAAVVSIGLNLLASALFASLPVLVFLRYDANPRIAGLLFASFGVGSVLGSVVAYRAVARLPLLKVAGVALVLSALPLWLLALRLPAYGVALVLACFGLFLPFVNAPMMGVITVRTPPALRQKVLTALFTVVTLASPVGLAVAGPALQAWGPRALYLGVAAAFSALALVYAAVVATRGAVPDGAPALG